MALERGKLSNVVTVGGGSTVAIVTVASSKKVYVKSVMGHNTGGAAGITSATGQVYFVPNGVTTDSPDYRIVDESIADRGSYTFQVYASPLVLENTGDALFVGTGDFESTGAGATCTFMISGYRES